jgi:tetratricopeptide (TPR) repeat protein
MISERRNTCLLDTPQARARWRVVCTLAVLLGAPVLISSLRAQESTAPEAPAAPKRLSIAFLGLENQTGDPNLAHWRHARILVSESFKEVEAVRVLSAEAVRYALRQVGLRAGAPIDPNQARQMGGHIEAQRVIWGWYTKKADQWHVTVRLMNVATGAVSPEFSGEASDWFDLRDKLNQQILTELDVVPAPAEREKMTQRWIHSPEALDWYLKMQQAQEQGKPAGELEQLCRNAVAADPNCEQAYCDLAGALATQGRLDPAREMAQKALQVRPDSARAHYVLGWLPMVQSQLNPAQAASYLEQAEAQFRQAVQLEPENADCQVDLARICAMRGRLEEAATVLERTVSLDRTNALAHASLAIIHVLRGPEGAALQELREARRYLPEGANGTNALSAMAAAYERLGRVSEALEYHERTLLLAREMGANPNSIRLLERKIEVLKSRLTPTFIQASPPKRYAEDELDRILWDKLTDDERALVGNPFSCTDAMRGWAKDLTRGADTDLDKAKAIFEALSARLIPGGQTRSRTAREVFAAWKDPKVHLVCMDHAVLFVALARAAGVDAFLVSVSRLPDGTARGHACAAVFAADRALLVDSAFRWFGVPHKQYMILDDLQATAALCFVNQGVDNPTELAAYRAGAKLWPDWIPGRLTLVAGLIRARQLPEARRLFAEIPPPPSQDYEAAVYWSLAGEPALEQDWDRAKECLVKSIAIWPGQSYAYFGLGRVYVRQHQLADARTAFRTCLRNEPGEWVAGMARAAIAQINEEIGIEAVPGTAPPASVRPERTGSDPTQDADDRRGE